MRTPEERFERKVDRSGECHLFLGSIDSGGYGTFTINRKPVRAHRFAYEVTFGKIPTGDGHHGTCVLHRCDNRACVRPDHLFLGTHTDNMKDKVEKGRHCRHFSGSTNPKAKLVESQVQEVRSMYASGQYTQEELARRFGISQTQISRITNEKDWAGVK